MTDEYTELLRRLETCNLTSENKQDRDCAYAATAIRPLQHEVKKLSTDDTHSCHPECPKIECVQRREIEELKADYSRIKRTIAAHHSYHQTELANVKRKSDEKILELKRERDELRSALVVARCPNKNCIDGAYAFGPDSEPQECEWCEFQQSLGGCPLGHGPDCTSSHK